MTDSLCIPVSEERIVRDRVTFVESTITDTVNKCVEQEFFAIQDSDE